MKHEEFMDELYRQIKLNAEYFKPRELLLLHDFAVTINKDDFEDK